MKIERMHLPQTYSQRALNTALRKDSNTETTTAVDPDSESKQKQQHDSSKHDDVSQHESTKQEIVAKSAGSDSSSGLDVVA